MKSLKVGLIPGKVLTLALLFIPWIVSSATFTVTNLNDFGEGTLRVAISNANASAGLDTIAFAINTNTAGVKTITLASALPVITEAVLIDGTTQPGFSNAPLIEINGNFRAGVHGLLIAGGGSTVRALSIRNCGTSSSASSRASGIMISTNGGNVVAGCYLGVNTNGTAALQNTADGITVDNSPNNVIGGTNSADRNVIGGNSQNGIQILGPGATNNRVMGNLIGWSVPATNAVANFNAGILLTNVTGNIIGGTNAGARNVIARNSSYNVLVQNSSGVVIAGNYIGLKPDGTTLSTNLDSVNGISINNSSNNVIGGLVEAARNVIGNVQNGVTIFGSNSVGNVVIGNFLGTGPAGTNTVANSYGVSISSGAQSNRIGGTAAGSPNNISGNRSYGVYLSSSNNLVQGNFIGVDITGQRAPLPLSASGAGIDVLASGNVIGGTTPAARNVISGNRNDGIQVGSFSAVLKDIVIQGNYIGTDAGGTLAVSNRNNGISVLLNVTNCLIGGTNAGAGNVISANGDNGIWLGGFSPVSGVQVLGNRIGFTADLRPTAPPVPSARICCPTPETTTFPGQFFASERPNGQHGIRCEHADRCQFGTPSAPNLISCADAGDCITIIDGTGNDFVNNGFANYGPFLTIDNFPGTQGGINTPVIGLVDRGNGHTHVQGSCFGTPNTTVTIHLMSGPFNDSTQSPTGDMVEVLIGEVGTGIFSFELATDDPGLKFSATAQDGTLNTSELAIQVPAVGPAGTANLLPQFSTTPCSFSLNSSLNLSLFNAGPSVAANTKLQVTFAPGSGGTLTSSNPFVAVPGGINVTLGSVAAGATTNPVINVQPDSASLRNGLIDVLLGNSARPQGFQTLSPAFNPVLPRVADPLIAVGDFSSNPDHRQDDTFVLDRITGNAYVILNPGQSNAIVEGLAPVADYCAQHQLHPTDVTAFRGAGGINQIAVSLVTWPWNPNSAGQILILPNDGAGNFTIDPSRVINAGSGATGLLNGDFNHDNIDDLAWVDFTANTANVALNNGANFFPAVQTSPTVGAVPVSAAVGDVNGDNNLDLVVLNQGASPGSYNQSIVSVLLGDGAGHLAAPTQLLNLPNFGLSIVGGLEVLNSTPIRKIVDFNNDGFPDFAVNSTRAVAGGGLVPTVSLLLNRPDAPGQFIVTPAIDLVDASATPFTPGLQGGVRTAVTDINNDGREDLVVEQAGTGCLTILRNQGPDGFFNPIFAQSGLGGFGAQTRVAVADVNADGTPDLCVVNSARVQLNFSVSTSTPDISAGLNSRSLTLPFQPEQPILLLPADLFQRGIGLVYAQPGPELTIQKATDLNAPVDIQWSAQTLFDVGTEVQPFPVSLGLGTGQKYFRAVQGIP